MALLVVCAGSAKDGAGVSEMCYKCDGFCETIRFRDTGTYCNLARQLTQVIEQETMILVRGSCRLDEIRRENMLPKEFYEHVFQCTTCGRKFIMMAETVSGCGGSWQRLSEDD